MKWTGVDLVSLFFHPSGLEKCIATYTPELCMGWVDPRVGLGWVWSGMGRKLVFLVSWLGHRSEMTDVRKNTLPTLGRHCQPSKLNQLNLFVGGCVQA